MKLYLILLGLCIFFTLAVCHDSTDETTTEGSRPARPKIVFPRRRLFRKKFNGALAALAKADTEASESVSTSVSMSVSSKVDFNKPEPAKPKPKFVPKTKPKHWKFPSGNRNPEPVEDDSTEEVTEPTTTEPPKKEYRLTLKPRLGYKFPSLNINRPKLVFSQRNRFTTTTTGRPGSTETETPPASFSPRPRPSFGKQAAHHHPGAKSTLRKLYRPTARTTAQTDEIPADDVIPDLTTSTSTTPGTTTPVPTTFETTTTSPTTTPTTTTTTTSTTTTTVPTTTTTTTEPTTTEPRKTTPKDMIIIPVPPSQRKPYHPVIMQVTKTPAVSSTERPQTKVVTYKLNKMFVPIGIYGKVLPKSEAGYYQQNNSEERKASADLVAPSTTPKPGPAIRHKGTSSEELVTSGDSSSEFFSAIKPSFGSITEADAVFSAQSWIPEFRKDEEEKLSRSKNRGKQFADASEVDLTMDYKPDISKISLTTQRPKIEEISLTTSAVPAYLGHEVDNVYSKYQNSMTKMGPPRPMRTKGRPTSMLDSIKNFAQSATSSIPGLIHGGLTQLSQFAQLEEQLFSAALADATKQKTTPSPYTGAVPDSETLEYFRKRPHLLNKGSQQSKYEQPSYSSGFKPATVSPNFAKAYYASTTTTTPKPSSHYTSTTSSEELSPYSSRPSARPSARPSVLSRSPKKANEWKDSYVDQLLEESAKYKYAKTASMFESDLLKNYWKEMNEKYSKNDLEEATSNIYEMLSGPDPPSVDDVLYMRPPEKLSRSSSSAFHDLLKMFRLGFTYGTNGVSRLHSQSHSHSTRKPSSHSHSPSYSSSHNVRSTPASNTVRSAAAYPEVDSWRPIKGGGKDPFFSINAGITIGGTPRPTGVYIGRGSHYSGSSKPYVPTGVKAHPGHDEEDSYSSSVGPDYSESLTSLYPALKGAKASSISSPFRQHYDSYRESTRARPSYSDYTSNYSPSHSSSHSSHYSPSHSSSHSSHYSPSYSSSHSSHYSPSHTTRKPSSTVDYNNVFYSNYGAKGKYEGKAEDESESVKIPANLAALYGNDPGIEIIPSSVYYKQKEQGIIRDDDQIAAVLRPAGVGADEWKASLPKGVSDLPQITLPEGKMPKEVQTLSQLNQYFQSAEPTNLNTNHFQPPLYRIIQESMKSQDTHLGHHQSAAQLLHQPVDSQIQQLLKLQEGQSQHQQQHHQHQQQQHHHHQQQQHHHHHHHQTPQQNKLEVPIDALLNGQLGHDGSKISSASLQHGHSAPQHSAQDILQSFQFRPSQIHQQLSHASLNSPYQQSHHAAAPTIPPAPPGAVSVKATGDSGLGFTDFELPTGIDPDIASLLKAELDKDDIPEEFRKEFLEQEKKKNEAAAASSHRPVAVAPPLPAPATSSYLALQRRSDAPKTIFHKPIPISPTILTPTRSRGPVRVPANVPRYVIDLARKLKSDKDLQGIIRVSSKKDGGPPVEYLYPVRG